MFKPYPLVGQICDRTFFLARLRGFAFIRGVRSLFINELNEKVFTTKPGFDSVGEVRPIAPCASRYCRLFSLDPPRGRGFSSLAEETHCWEPGKSSLQSFST